MEILAIVLVTIFLFLILPVGVEALILYSFWNHILISWLGLTFLPSMTLFVAVAIVIVFNMMFGE